MKRVFIIFLIVSFILVSLNAADTETLPSASFDLVFVKTGVSDFQFVSPSDITASLTTSAGLPDTVSSFNFDPYIYTGTGSLSAGIGVAWNIYEEQFQLFVSFIDGTGNPDSGYMLSFVEGTGDSGDKSYNFNVSLGTVVGAGPSSKGGITAPSSSSTLTSLQRTIYLFGSVNEYHKPEPDSIPLKGGVVLNCTFTPPEAGLSTGQYSGYVVMTLRTP